MSEPSLQELQESIEELEAYRDRLHKEVLTVAKKLRLPQNKVEATISEHTELRRLKNILSQLMTQQKEKL